MHIKSKSNPVRQIGSEHGCSSIDLSSTHHETWIFWAGNERLSKWACRGRWYVQDWLNQDSEQNEVDGMKKGGDSTGKVMHVWKSDWWFVMRKIQMVELGWRQKWAKCSCWLNRNELCA